MSRQPSILVIGDAMLDTHLFGDSCRLSPEAPVPIVEHKKGKDSLGGAANVAAHIAIADVKCLFAYKSFDFKAAGYMAKSEYDDLRTLLVTNKIEPVPLYHKKMHYPTTKQRIWANKQQLCRIDREDSTPPDNLTENKWLKCLVETIEKQNVKTVILSDYNKGTLTDSLVTAIAGICAEWGIKTIMDPKRPSFPSIKHLTAIKPNIKEIHSTNYPPHKCSMFLKETYLINTLGKDGVALWHKGHCIYTCDTVAEEVYDVTGCGDSFNALLGLAMHNDMNIKRAIVAANKAASYTIKHIGCYCLTKEEIDCCLAEAKAANIGG
jgi:D-beta-D-heptose 7-phosphate kinase/D-beta-D-heptose 1-phosphate adenosyltransferase